MKLKSRFALIAALCAVEMALLAGLTMAGASLIHKIQNFQFRQQECQYALSDIINYLNQTIYWSTDTKTVNDVWKNKIISSNKKFRELSEAPITKIFPKSFIEEIDEVNNIWIKVVTLTNPFNPQMQAIQQQELSDEERNYISRYGIKAGATRFPDSENVDTLQSRIILIEQQMKDLIKNSSDLQVKMTEMYGHIIVMVEHYTKWYQIIVIVLGLVFIGLIFISIAKGTDLIVSGIKTVRDMSLNLAQRDFTTEIEPSGSNEMQALMRNMNNMVYEINNFFLIVKKTASKAISSGYSINDSSTSTAAATNEINSNVEEITMEFDQINESMERAVRAINITNEQVRTLVSDNQSQTLAIDESTNAISSMASAVVGIRENAIKRTRAAAEMRELVSDGDSKISATNEILEEVMGQLDEIGEVVTLIDSITEQTNLLSMNAAIESAHAGEFGKGFAVVAEEIRSLAESTADNAKKINEAVSNVIEKVTQAHQSSQLASKAFSKVSNHSSEMIESFTQITKEIGNIDDQTHQITQKTDITASTADKINSYCTNLAAQQETVAQEITAIKNLFQNALESIHQISQGTEDIVTRMDAVGTLSKESYKNMTDLENVLEEFKTNEGDEEELQEAIDDNAINTVISDELRAQLEADFHELDGASGVDFNPDEVEEVEELSDEALTEETFMDEGESFDGEELSEETINEDPESLSLPEEEGEVLNEKPEDQEDFESESEEKLE